MNKKSQTWSMEAMVALMVFIGAIIFFGSYFLYAYGSKSRELNQDAQLVIEALSNEEGSFAIVDSGTLNATKLDGVVSQDYAQIREGIRTLNDFCFFLEDSQGNIINLNASTIGKGSSAINVSGIPCTT